MLRFLLYIILMISGSFLACQEEAPEPVAPVTPNPSPAMPAQTHTYSYLALGDSYTIGESVPENERWGVMLAGLLRAKGLSVGNPTTVARTGWTTGELIAAIKDRNITQTFDLVSLLIGVNNQYRGLSVENYRTEFKELLQTSVKFAKGEPSRVIVLSIPDWGTTPFASGYDRERIARGIDTFNAVAKEETEKAGIVFIDITTLSRQAPNDPSLLAHDGLHYSGKMHQQWAYLALPAAEKILK